MNIRTGLITSSGAYTNLAVLFEHFDNIQRSYSFYRVTFEFLVVLQGGALSYLEASCWRSYLYGVRLTWNRTPFTCIKATYVFARYFPFLAHLCVILLLYRSQSTDDL